VIVAASMVGFAYLPLGGKADHPSGRAMEDLLCRLPLSALASARNLPMDSLRARLDREGMAPARPDATIEEIAGSDHALRAKALNALLRKPVRQED
jgi:hypothetical protein